MDAKALITSTNSCSNLYFRSLQMQFQPPPPPPLQLLQPQQHHSPYFPSLQMQFQPPQQQHSSSSCLIGMKEEDDEELLNLAAATLGYSGFNFEENMLFDSTYNNNYYEHSNYCFPQYHPECYCHLPFNHHMETEAEADLQIPFHGELDSFIHFADQQLHPLEALDSSSPSHNLELPPKTLTLTTADVAAPVVRKSAVALSVNNDGDRKRVTAQSLAARERRRKITRKTQELGKLIPGGTKMNTAEMLQSAFKYIQFLQSQLQLLQLMSSSSYPDRLNFLQESQEKAAPPPLQVVASPVVQEKLYMVGCCIVPRAFVKILIHNTNDSSISDELHGIIELRGIID